VHRTVMIGLVGALMTTVVAIASAGAGTNRTSVTHARLDVSSRAAINHYLRRHGIDPRRVVVQRARRAYAGPNCPGRGWSCTTARRVFQIASETKAECTDNTVTGPGQTCSITQMGTDNTARCKLSNKGSDPAAVQNCTIIQTGVRNDANVDQTIEQHTTSGGTADQFAYVDQTGTERNSSDVHQQIESSADSKVATTQSQEANQGTTVYQQGPYTGGAAVDNDSHVDQNQHLTAKADPKTGNVTQDQNTGCCGPDSEAFVNQDSAGGVNHSNLHQRNDLDANANTSGAVEQTQGSSDGGVDGHSPQSTVAPGFNRLDANQDKNYNENASKKASSVSQTQLDPGICCSTQSGNPAKDMQKIDQHSSLQTSDMNADQTLLLLLNCDSDNPDGCNGKEDANVNGFKAKNTTPPSHIGIACSSFESEGACVPAPCEQSVYAENPCPSPPDGGGEGLALLRART
jgi:hypothetical protein